MKDKISFEDVGTITIMQSPRSGKDRLVRVNGRPTMEQPKFLTAFRSDHTVPIRNTNHKVEERQLQVVDNQAGYDEEVDDFM